MAWVRIPPLPKYFRLFHFFLNAEISPYWNMALQFPVSFRFLLFVVKLTFFPSGLRQRFSIPVLAPHRSAHFVCYSYHFRRLFYSNASALRSGHHTIFLHDSSSKRTYSIHSALKCARREFKLYIFTDVYDVTLVRAWRCCATQIHEWMFWSEVNFSGFPLLRE